MEPKQRTTTDDGGANTPHAHRQRMQCIEIPSTADNMPTV